MNTVKVVSMITAAVTVVVTGTGCKPVPDDGATGRSAVWYVADESGSAWPIREAAQTWNRSVGHRVFRYGRCPTDSRCVRVKQVSGYESEEVGRTTVHSSRATVRFNGAYALYTQRLRRAAACHELGHVLGLRHNEDADSCMNRNLDTAATRPGRDDVNKLK